MKKANEEKRKKRIIKRQVSLRHALIRKTISPRPSTIYPIGAQKNFLVSKI